VAEINWVEKFGRVINRLIAESSREEHFGYLDDAGVWQPLFALPRVPFLKCRVVKLRDMPSSPFGSSLEMDPQEAANLGEPNGLEKATLFCTGPGPVERLCDGSVRRLTYELRGRAGRATFGCAVRRVRRPVRSSGELYVTFRMELGLRIDWIDGVTKGPAKFLGLKNQQPSRG
jgi:hypothetical protein